MHNLKLRQNVDRETASRSLQVKRTQRNGYLKDMLVQKFLSKVAVDVTGPITPQTRDLEHKLNSAIVKEFDIFISDQNFTQKKLAGFESQLKTKLQDILKGQSAVSLKDGNAGRPPRSTRYTSHNLSSVPNDY